MNKYAFVDTEECIALDLLRENSGRSVNQCIHFKMFRQKLHIDLYLNVNLSVWIQKK